jgi:flagellar hook-associated protein 2
MAGPISNDYVSMINKKGSGYNIPVIVDAIVNAEIDPIKSNVTARKVLADAAISGMAGLKSSAKLTQTAVNTLSSLNDYSLASSRTSMLTLTATDSSKIGSFSKNITNVVLASAKALSIDNFSPPNQALGAGLAQTLTIVVGPNPDTVPSSQVPSTIAVLATDNVASLAGKINNITGLTAELVDIGDGSAAPYRIVITGDVGGNGNFMMSSTHATDARMVSGYNHVHDPNNSLLRSASNATFEIDGVPVERSSNTIDDLVGGVTIKLLAGDTQPFPAAPLPTTITSALSSATVEASIKSLMTELNLYKADMDALGFVDEVGDADGELAQNSYLRSAQRQFQKLISTPILGYNGDGIAPINKPVHFVDFGIKTSRDGSLVFDQSTFNRTFSKEPWKFDAISQDVAYSTDPNVIVSATPTSGMPAGGHPFANHQRILPTSSTSSIGGFRSFNDRLVGNSTITYHQNPQHGPTQNHSIQTNPGETVTTFIGRVNALPGLTATATTTGNPAYRSIAFSITQDTRDTTDTMDSGTRLTMTGNISNQVTGVPIIREYTHFGSASESLPAQNFFIHGQWINISNGQTPTQVAALINAVGGLSASMYANHLVISGPSSGVTIGTPTIRNAAGNNNTGVTTQANVVALNDSVTGMNNANNESDESWQDVVNVIPSNGGFNKVDQQGNSSSVGTGAGTYSSSNYPGFQFTTSNDQGPMHLYVGRSVRTLVNNFFNDALATNSTHQEVSVLYTERSKDLADQLAQIDERQELLRSRYTTQFAAMESIVTTGSSTSEYLENLVAGWNKS